MSSTSSAIFHKSGNLFSRPKNRELKNSGPINAKGNPPASIEVDQSHSYQGGRHP